MAKKESLYNKAKANPKSITFAEIQTLAKYAGFVYDRQKGSHKLYKRSDDPAILVSFQPRKGEKKKAKIYQVRQLLDHIDDHNLLELEEENGQ